MGNVVLHIEMLVPLCIGQSPLLGIQYGKVLLVHCGERVLVLSLLEDHPLNHLLQLEWVIGRAHCHPGNILLHFVLEQLHALPKNEGVCLPLMSFQHSHPSALVAALIRVVHSLLVSQLYGHVLCRLEIPLGYIVIELCQLCHQSTIGWIVCNLHFQQSTA